jgi:hypothetical protein
LSFTEANDQKGVLEITLGSSLKHRFIPLQTRIMVDAEAIDCSTLNIDQILKRVKDTMQSIEPQEKIIRLRLDHIPAHLLRGIDFHQIQNLGKGAVHFEIKTTQSAPDGTTLEAGYKMKSLADEYEKFLATQHLPEKDVLLRLGLHYIHSTEEEEREP